MATNVRSKFNDTTSTGGETMPPQKPTTDPFGTPFDDDHDEPDDEWWNDEESPPKKPEETATGSRLTQWPTLDKPTKQTVNSKRSSAQKYTKRYSVQKPTRDKSRKRQKKQNALAGIKVITDFSKPRGPGHVARQTPVPSQSSRNPPRAGQFIDLAALQALEAQAPANSGGLWRSIMDMLPNKDEAEHHTHENPDDTTEPSSIQRVGSRRQRGLVPAPLNLQSGLSPNDRDIVIGISIPSASMNEHILSPETATSETSKIIQSYGFRSPDGETPETPAIVITPAQDSSIWSPLDQNNSQRPRAASSVYSRATNYGVPAASDAPPLPQMPAYAMKENQQREQNKVPAVRESVGTIFADDEEWTSPSRTRAMSSYTVFEEDESPTIVRKGRARAFSLASKRASGPAAPDHRQSKGWWNLGGILTRSNTVASPQTPNQERPSLPNLNTAAMKAQEASKDSKWEKTFSPVTPNTSTTIASDAWWDKQSPSGPVANPFRRTISQAFSTANGHRSQKSEDEAGTLQFMLAASAHPDNDIQKYPSTRIQGTATSALSPSDREVPFMLSGSISRPQQADNVQTRFETTPRAIPAESSQILDVFPQPPRAAIPRPSSIQADSPQPPPYSPPRQNFPRYRAVLPPGHPGNQSNLQQPSSPGPVSPGLQQAMSSRGGIALSEVPLTPPVARRPIKLNSAYPGLPANPRVGLPITASDIGITSEKARKAEAKRRRYEREDAAIHKAGGLWRGRGCIPERGCYGRQGAEGRKRRRICFGLFAGFLTMIILIIVLATTLHRKPHEAITQTQWLNLTGFPPIFTGISTVAAPDNPIAKTGCVFPSTLWSCALPKELQQSVAANQPNQPNFRFDIEWDSSKAANATFANVTGGSKHPARNLGGNAVSAGQFIKRLVLGRQTDTFKPSPAPPALAEQAFLGNTTDGIVSNSKGGEPTPFYITFMTAGSVLTLSKRASTNPSVFPNVSSFIPLPDNSPDGTAAPANLLPFPFQQPLRLYDRGLDTEHYGFYTYYNRSIFLKSTTALNQTNLGEGEVPADENGGSTESEAAVRCTWAETRFLVQMWTRKTLSATLLGAATDSTTSSSTPAPLTVTSSMNATANNFTRPGSFPYPVTITTDRHGGNPAKKLVYCYALDTREHNVANSGKVQLEQRFFGGTLINPAPSTFSNTSDSSLGGFDGGTGGCSCEWQNWKSVIRT